MKEDFFNDDFFNEEYLTEDLLDEGYLQDDNLGDNLSNESNPGNSGLDEEFITRIMDNPDLTDEEVFQILNENDPQKSKQLAENLLKFSEANKLAEERSKANEQLEEHASINSGFHDYEKNSFMTKQKLSDLCTLYRVFFENDPAYSAFLKEIKDYADLDPYEHANYEAEVKLVKDMPGKIAAMVNRLDEDEKRFQQEVSNTLKSSKYKNASPKEKKKLDQKLLVKSEVIDNRRRALASFENYFDNMSKGDLNDLEDQNNAFYYQNGNRVSIKETVDSINTKKNLVVPEHNHFLYIKNGKPSTAYYINASGVELDASYDLNRYRHKGKKKLEEKTEANNNITLKDMRNDPIFPHEPRMTDVSQASTGDCYIMACLQNIARLYPQKIKDMIRDNGDGTATVRLFTRETNQSGQKVYNPVYVRVDKTMPTVQTNAISSRLAQDCLWVNLIEKAYAMSGLHMTKGSKQNVPINPADEQHKDWRPSISQIEGGMESNMMEILLGDEGAAQRFAVPILKNNSFDPESIKHVDVNNAESVTKHVFYNIYKAANGNVSEEEFMSLSKDQIINNCKFMMNLSDEFSNSKEPETMLSALYDVIQNKQTKVLENRQKNPDSPDISAETFGEGLRNFNTWFKGVYKPDANQSKTHKKIMDIVEQGVYEANYSHKNLNAAPNKEDFYNNIANALDKGLIVSFGSRKNEEAELIKGGHAYSIIGAYKTNDVPPEFYFRVKNPWTKTPSNNGLEYVNEDGKVTGKWVNVKDGIFDMKMEDLVSETDYVFVNGSKELEATPHMKTEGYDIITPEAAKNSKKEKVSADLLTDYVKVANDLYDAMVSTNSFFSKDSPEYKELMAGIKDYRHNLAQSFGKDIKDMTKLTEPLKKLAEKYEAHVDKEKDGASSRQKARAKVSRGIRSMVDMIESGKNPQQEAEKSYAKKLVVNYYLDKNEPLPNNIDEVANNLYKNKAFRKIANATNISNLNTPSDEQIKTHLESIEKSLKGRGRDKDKKIEDIVKEQPNGPVMG